MLVGAARFAGNHDFGALVARLARRAAFPDEIIHHIDTPDGLWLRAIGPAACEAQPVITPVGDRTTFLFGDACRLPNWRAKIGSRVVGNPASAQIPLRWLAVDWNSVLRKLSLTSDRLGLLWLYYVRIPEGIAFATDFGALAREVAGSLTVDWDTMLLELAYGYTPDDRTIYHQIHVVPPGSLLTISSHDIDRIVCRPLRYTDDGAGLTQQQKFERLDQLYARIVARTAELTGDLSVSLSAGYDSRYALAFLRDALRGKFCCTFGHPESEEVRGARRIARETGLAWTLFDIPAGDWIQWKRDIQALGNAGMTQWSGWAESWLTHLVGHGLVPVIGYLGDALSGKHLGGDPAPPDWISFWERWSTRDGWASCSLLSSGARQRIASAGRERLRHAVAGLSLPFAHQAAMHLDLYARQRRWVAGQPNLIARFGTPLLFFYDEALIDFWTGLPADDLIGQRLYLDYARSRFPALFRPEAKAPGLARRIVDKAMRVVTRTDRGRPRVIDARRFIESCRPEILALADRVAPLAGEHIDMREFRRHVESFGRESTVAGGLLARAINVFLLLEPAVGAEATSGEAARYAARVA
jgi:hypothetical protein